MVIADRSNVSISPLRSGTKMESRKQSRRWRRDSGFTLVELLVVVSIIALLISILLPSLRQAREQAKAVKCLAHLRGLGQAGATFANDHGNQFQLSASENGVNEADPDRQRFEYDTDGELLTWPVALAQAAGVKIDKNWKWGIRRQNISDAMDAAGKISDVFELPMCPSDKVKIASPFWPNNDGLRGTGDPDDPQSNGYYWGKLSYGINEDVVGATTEEGTTPVWKDGFEGEDDGEDKGKAGMRLQGKLDRIFDPSTVLLTVDAGANTVEDARNSEMYDPNGDKAGDGLANLITSARASKPSLGSSMRYWYQRIPVKRHPNGVVNVGFCDFHAAPAKPTVWRMHPRAGYKIPSDFNQMVRVSPYQWRDLTGRN